VLLGYGRSFADTSIAVILLTLLYALRCCACARDDGGFAVEMRERRTCLELTDNERHSVEFTV